MLCIQLWPQLSPKKDKQGAQRPLGPVWTIGRKGLFPDFSWFWKHFGGFLWRPEFCYQNYETTWDGYPTVQANFLTRFQILAHGHFKVISRSLWVKIWFFWKTDKANKMNRKPQKRTHIPKMDKKSIVGVFRTLMCPTPTQLPLPPPCPAGGGG